MAVELHVQRSGEGAPLLILHGLFGSGINWRTLARGLAQHFEVWLLDARNHARSPHASEMSYAAMRDDVIALMDAHDLQSAHLLGHSMGGKTAMWTALTQPARVRSLTVADIAPVDYGRTLSPELRAMQALDLATVKRRADADSALSEAVPDAGVRAFLLQNLAIDADGARWRINLAAIAGAARELTGFPEVGERRYEGPTLFINGGQSDYVRPEHEALIDSLFPHATISILAGAGHWLHAEQPQQFSELLLAHLKPLDA